MLVRLVAAALLVLCCSNSLVRAQVKVESHPPAVKTRTFDPHQPPSDMPPLDAGEAAVCESKFACGVQVEVEITQPAEGKPTAKVTGVTADLRLTVIIWLPTQTTAKVRAHEEGHRRISEVFYARGKSVAETLAKKYVGQSLDIEGSDPGHTRPIIEKLANEFCQEYLGAIEVPSQKVQEEYDRLTDHGRNEVPEKRAIDEAMKRGEAVKR